MKALQLVGTGRLELRDVPRPEPASDEILVRTRAATLCTSDLNDIRDNPFGIVFPMTLGHEGAGEVAAVGSAVTGFEEGDRVATHPVHPCGRCPSCSSGIEHLCMNMRYLGLNMSGTFAEFYVVRRDRARLLPAATSFASASLAEPVAVCLEALAQARLTLDASLLVVGDGPFGVMMTRLAGDRVRRVVLAGWSPERLKAAQHAVTINTRDEPDAAATLLKTEPPGFDAAVLAVASQRALDDALACLKPKGRLVIFSALGGRPSLDLLTVHLKELEIIGACNDDDRFDAAVGYLTTTPSASDIVTHRFDIDQYRQAFALVEEAAGGALKVAFTFS